MSKTLLFSLFTFIILSLSIVTHVSGQTVIQMEKDGGVYKIPCEINGLRLKLIFDTGASNVCISESIALMMLENGYIDKSDIKGTSSSVVADGRIVDNTIVNIRSLKIGRVDLSDVEAVVMHQQSAPLLLGQSAIQKLGKISIDGDKIMISQGQETISVSQPAKRLTIDEILSDNFDHETHGRYREILNKAEDAYNNELYELAAQYYSSCYEHIYFKANEKLNYAYSLRYIKRYNEALIVYNEVGKDIDDLDINNQIDYLFGLQVCYHELGDYFNSIIVGKNALQKTRFDNSLRGGILYFIACAYKENGDIYSAKKTITNELNSYLAYMGISATDCWDKGYKDPYIAYLYNCLRFISEEYVKYIIISAAWGNKDAIESVKEYSLSYHQKPSNYEY